LAAFSHYEPNAMGVVPLHCLQSFQANPARLQPVTDCFEMKRGTVQLKSSDNPCHSQLNLGNKNAVRRRNKRTCLWRIFLLSCTTWKIQI